MNRKSNQHGTENDRRPVELSQEDLDLARRAQKDRKAAHQLVSRLMPRIRHAVIMAIGANQDVDDLTHTCMTEVLDNLHSYKGAGSLEAWAGRLSYRVMMRNLSRQRRSERTVSIIPDDIGVSYANPEEEASREHLRTRLMVHLQKMPKERRMALVLRLVHQHSVPEVAEMTASPINTVRDRIRVGLKELRKSILKDPEIKDFLEGVRNE